MFHCDISRAREYFEKLFHYNNCTHTRRLNKNRIRTTRLSYTRRNQLNLCIYYAVKWTRVRDVNAISIFA